MGKKKGGRGRGGKRSAKTDEYRTDLLDKSSMKNERFEAYYKSQNILPEEEWDSFLDALKRPLPTTFRVAGSRLTATSLNEAITDVHVPILGDVEFEGQKIPPPVQIPWYPEGLAWQFNVPKKVLRKSPEFKKFHSFLVFETEVGNISRQEAVSMLPPLFLDVQPHHRVMDMCAAPGSKTAQLLEALHAQDTLTASSIPSGLLIANDSDYKRTHLLIHQSARLPSPALMVTNLDASNYPSMKIPAEHTSTSSQTKLETLLFDRILCDVPCSGDGTLRKNLEIWKRWQPNDGNGLHGLQLRILQRAMKMLKPDGRIVYSTCSMNPTENEAVIAAALNWNTDFELLDVSSVLPALKRRPGMTVWKPTADKSVKTAYDTYAAFVEAEPQAKTKLTEGHWPPTNAEELHLERCIRIYPHLQDTGGFFVAVLQRKASVLASAAKNREKKRRADEAIEAQVQDAKKPRLEETPSTCASTQQVDVEGDVAMSDAAVRQEPSSSAVAETKENGFKEMPYTFLSREDPTLTSCLKRLNLTSTFPSSDVLVRNPEGDVVRSMYLTNSIVKAVVQNNDFARIRLIAAGTKVFTRQEGAKVHEKLEEQAGAGAQYRILGEGLPVVLPYVDPATIITAGMKTLKTLVESYYPLFSSFEKDFQDTMDPKELGCHVMRFPPGDEEGGSLTHELVLPIWKSTASATLMIDKKAKSALSLRVFGKELPATANARPRNKDGENGKNAKAPDAEETKGVDADVDEEGEGEGEDIPSDSDVIVVRGL